MINHSHTHQQRLIATVLTIHTYNSDNFYLENTQISSINAWMIWKTIGTMFKDTCWHINDAKFF